MTVDKEFYTELGYSEEWATELATKLDSRLGKDIAFYRNLGYSLIESEYLALNVFNEVESGQAPESLVVPSGFVGGNLGLGGTTYMRSVVLDNSTVDSTEDYNDYIEEDYNDFCEQSVSLDAIAPLESAHKSVISGQSLGCVRDTYRTEEICNTIRDKSSFKDVVTSPTVTIRATVNTASFNYIKDSIKNKRPVYDNIIRTEEVINYLDYNLDTGISAELTSVKGTDYMLVGIKGKHIDSIRKNIVLLVDTSGSMYKSRVQLQKTIMTIAKQLKPEDTVSLVAYSDNDKVVFEGLQGDSISDIILSLSKMNIQGCTNGSTGLDKAYDIASRYFIENGSNRVIIVTDGDFNFGTYDQSGLRQLIKEKKKTGIFLTVLGMYNNIIYQEQTMETLARDGNGNYFRISNEADILETCKNRFDNNTVAVAKDVKVQIEFNPAKVAKYKLVGYETRQLSNEDFKNDDVESETLGNDQVVIALFELVYKTNSDDIQPQHFKYQTLNTTGSNDVCTVQLNYKEVSGESTESKTESLEVNNQQATDNINKAIMAKCFVEYAVAKNRNALDIFKELGANIEDTKIEIMKKLINK